MKHHIIPVTPYIGINGKVGFFVFFHLRIVPKIKRHARRRDRKIGVAVV